MTRRIGASRYARRKRTQRSRTFTRISWVSRTARKLIICCIPSTAIAAASRTGTQGGVRLLAGASRVNQNLTNHGDLIIGRMGQPYRDHGLRVISLIVDGEKEQLQGLTAVSY